MCGIVGTVKFHGVAEAESVRSAAATMIARGPDDSGVWISENVGLGHRRLAILDVTPAGHQPMSSPDGRFVIVYNGEIYNFRDLRGELEERGANWRSSSDTEVVLAAYAKWGPRCLKRFRGMFAFAIWDRQRKSLFAARDRMGVKPFYYCCSSAGFAFASRPRALFHLFPALPGDLDFQALRFYLEAGYVPAPHSIFQSIRKLPPAHSLTLTGGELRVERYWDLRSVAPEPDWESRREDELLDELGEIVSRNVRRRMVSDVPVGAFLSGGIDSSVVAAVMAKHSSRPIQTFTIGFDAERYDESVYASEVARKIGSEHSCERLNVSELLELLPRYFEEFDEPFSDSSAIPTMAVSRAARRHVTVSLSGDGGDELFGGYPYYGMVHRLEPFFQLPAQIRRWTASLAGIIPRHRFRLLAAALRKQNPAEVFCFARSLTKDFKSLLDAGAASRTVSFSDFLLETAKAFPPGLRAAEQAMRLDMLCTLPGDYLQKVDVSSMAFSLESREPLLDHELVEWSLRLPLKWKLRGARGKYLFRKLAFRYVPRELLERPKHGFEIPLAEWLRGPLAGWAEGRFQEKSLFERVPLNQTKLLEVFELHRSGRRNAHPLLWAAAVLLEFCSRLSKREPATVLAATAQVQ
ncbi:MAG TPA: asparagine synthase (glutamine-hydrolyzing) [archaeon]|nr:asparagine synthase (glutamine-hydrolyzing) [archaeon]